MHLLFQIYCMVCSGMGVWMALDKRPVVKLYHSETQDHVADIDVSHTVSKMLSSTFLPSLYLRFYAYGTVRLACY